MPGPERRCSARWQIQFSHSVIDDANGSFDRSLAAAACRLAGPRGRARRPHSATPPGPVSSGGSGPHARCAMGHTSDFLRDVPIPPFARTDRVECIRARRTPPAIDPLEARSWRARSCRATQRGACGGRFAAAQERSPGYVRNWPDSSRARAALHEHAAYTHPSHQNSWLRVPSENGLHFRASR